MRSYGRLGWSLPDMIFSRSPDDGWRERDPGTGPA
jgi:hypothetical protein